MFASRAPILGSLLGSAFVLGQSFVPIPNDVSIIQSANYPGSSISYKKVLCLNLQAHHHSHTNVLDCD